MSKNTESESTNSNAFYDWLEKTYEKFNLLSEFKDDDTILVIIGKVIVRILGVILLILLSPFIMLGLMLAFAAAL
ncbi:MAG: hypothetical protein AAF738_02655 [Bacteroidota bacterium]